MLPSKHNLMEFELFLALAGPHLSCRSLSMPRWTRVRKEEKMSNSMRKEETLSTSMRKVETLRRGIWKEEILRK